MSNASLTEPPRNTSCDAFRVFGFLSIFLCHYNQDRFYRFGLLLPLFFVFSGFLITRNFETRQFKSNASMLGSFYAKRVLRIFPAYYAALIALVVAGCLKNSWIHFLYLFNFQIFLNPKPPFALDNRLVNHFWTLCVEEQFYLIYPLLFVFFSSKRRPYVLITLLVLSIALRTFLSQFRDPITHMRLYYGVLLPIAGEYILVGALAHYYMGTSLAKKLNVYFYYAVSITLIVLQYSFGHPIDEPDNAIFSSPTFRQDLLALELIFFFIGLWLDTKTLFHKIVSFRIYSYLGPITYPAYIWHFIILHKYQDIVATFTFLRFVPPFIGSLGITLLLSLMSWHLLEEQLIKRRKAIFQFVERKLNLHILS